jgi:hypothetical protein
MGTFAPPAIPWLKAQPLELDGLELGPGLEGFDLAGALQRLCALPELKAVVAFGSRGRGDASGDSDLDLAVIAKESQLSPEAKLQLWTRCREAMGVVPVGCDLIVQGIADAARLSQSRWHVMGDVAREGRVLYVAP